jgi:hypothetical protein
MRIYRRLRDLLLTASRSQGRCVAARAGLRRSGAVGEWQLDVQRCARAGQALEREGAADRLGTVLEAEQSGATGGIGTALAVVADRDGEHIIVHLHVNAHRRRPRVLRRVRQRLRNDVIRRHLHSLGQTRLHPRLELDRHHGAARERLQRRPEAALGQDLMDEPTAALGVAETRRVEELIRRLRDRGRAILVVSHSLDQVFRLADRICVLRRGKQVGIRRTSETTGGEIIAMITGLR